MRLWRKLGRDSRRATSFCSLGYLYDLLNGTPQIFLAGTKPSFHLMLCSFSSEFLSLIYTLALNPGGPPATNEEGAGKAPAVIQTVPGEGKENRTGNEEWKMGLFRKLWATGFGEGNRCHAIFRSR